MALLDIDVTGNEEQSTLLGKIKAMLIELYAASSTTPTPSVTSLTATGAVQGATVVGTTSIAGGTVAGTTGTFSGLVTGSSAKIDTGTKTASATAGAATLAKSAGVITSEALTTAAGATYTLTLTNSTIAAADQVFASVQLGSATTGVPVVTTVTPAAGSVVIVLQNVHASAALNGTIKVSFLVLKN